MISLVFIVIDFNNREKKDSIFYSSTFSTFQKGGAKHHNPFWFYLFHLSTFQKSRVNRLAPPF
jgi:hypothetical protein